MKRLLLIGLLFSFSFLVLAADFSSSSFIIRDPVISEFSGRSSSAGFENISSGGQTAIGESNSGSFTVKSGFLYFTDILVPSPPAPAPIITSIPTPSVGAGGALAPGGSSGLFDVVFEGVAYPLRPVSILKDGQIIVTQIADNNGKFEFPIFDLVTGDYMFGVIGEDAFGQTGSVFYRVHIEKGLRQFIRDVILPPTIGLDRANIVGQSVSSAKIDVQISSLTKNIVADAAGIYRLPYRTLGLLNKIYKIKSQATLTDGRKSPFSRDVTLDLTGVELPEAPIACPLKGDLNNDCRVNLIDLSILAYWWERPALPIRIDLNKDGKINLADFSVLVFYWTG